MSEPPAEPARVESDRSRGANPDPPANPFVALSDRELEILEMVVSGSTNGEIAERLDISVDAVKFHLASIYRKLGVTNRTEAMSTYAGVLGTPLRGVSGVKELPARTQASTGGDGGGGGVDLNLFGRVLWRFKWLVALGLVVGLGLGYLVYQRQSEEYASYATVFVTQNGFPWGRLALPEPVIGDTESGSPSSGASTGPEFADPTRLSSLAILYSRFADSDPVRRLMLKDGPLNGRIEAAPLLASDNESDALPLISIAGIADTPGAAISIAQRATTSLISYIEGQQAANDIPLSQRVEFQVVKKPETAKVLSGKSWTLPVVVFLAVMLAVVALAFLLQNIRPPKPQKVAAESDEAQAGAGPSPAATA